MTRSAEGLSAGDWAVLGFLAQAPTHGFAITQALAPDGEIGKVWSVRRPLVYRAIDTLTGIGFATPAGTVFSSSGPRRTVLKMTPAGRRELSKWLAEPVAHVRDARSLLLLKLLFLDRRHQDNRPLLAAQRARFEVLAKCLVSAIERAEGFDRVLLRWRLETTTAAISFIDTIIAAPP